MQSCCCLFLIVLNGLLEVMKLQKRALDIIEAYEQIKEVDSGFIKIFDHSIRIAEKVGSTIKMPCIASRQQHRNNTKATTPCEYFLKNTAIPFLDYIISFIDEQFF